MSDRQPDRIGRFNGIMDAYARAREIIATGAPGDPVVMTLRRAMEQLELELVAAAAVIAYEGV